MSTLPVAVRRHLIGQRLEQLARIRYDQELGAVVAAALDAEDVLDAANREIERASCAISALEALLDTLEAADAAG